MLQQYPSELLFNWETCLNNGLLPVPSAWDIENHPIPPGSGIFVYLSNLPANYGDEQTSGLVGYGITSDHAFDLWPKLGEY